MAFHLHGGRESIKCIRKERVKQIETGQGATLLCLVLAIVGLLAVGKSEKLGD